MRSHALLSPSSAYRWLACTPSAKLESTFPESSSTYADEGTLAHSISELIIMWRLNQVTEPVYEQAMDEYRQHELYEPAMEEHCDNYAVFVIEQFHAAKVRTIDARLFLEQKFDLSDYIPEGYGHVDVSIIADGVLDITDLKYGKGVPVSAINNQQLKLYGLGALKQFDYLYDIRTVRMTVFQPRIDNVNTWEISVTDLLQWAETELKTLAAMAFEGEGEYVPGDHCRFCKAKPVCKKLADYNLQLAQYDFRNPDLLIDEEVTDILDRVDLFKNWVESVEAYALDQAVKHGKQWPGYKVVEGRSNRKYSNETAIANLLREKGHGDDVIFKKSLYGITELTKLLGKKQFDLIVSPLLVKPPGKPALVAAADPRPAISSLENARQDFAEA